jgi:hypothetical protein
MPKSQGYIQDIKRLDRLLQIYNNRRWGYFHFSKPLWEQRWFSQFMKITLLLQKHGLTPEEFLQIAPYRRGRLLPAFLDTLETRRSVERFAKNISVKKDRKVGMDQDKQFLREMMESTGQEALFLINFFWDDLHPDTQKAYKPFHNEFYLSTSL